MRDEAPVFLLSSGRSGSTLLQRLLNCHPGLVMWGEHHGFLAGLGYTFNRMFIEGPENPFPREAAGNPGPGLLLPTFADPTASIEWANPCTAEEYARMLRGFISGYFGAGVPAGVRWGFKEIRYQRQGEFEMLRLLYPAGRFVFLRRNPLVVARSQLLAWSSGEEDTRPLDARTASIRDSVADIRANYARYASFTGAFSDIATIVDYEALVADPREVMRGLLPRLALDPAQYDWDLAARVAAHRASETLARGAADGGGAAVA